MFISLLLCCFCVVLEEFRVTQIYVYECVQFKLYWINISPYFSCLPNLFHLPTFCAMCTSCPWSSWNGVSHILTILKFIFTSPSFTLLSFALYRDDLFLSGHLVVVHLVVFHLFYTEGVLVNVSFLPTQKWEFCNLRFGGGTYSMWIYNVYNSTENINVIFLNCQINNLSA